MKIELEEMVSITEANQNFSKVARKASKQEEVIILKNNKPKYVLIDIENTNYIKLTELEKLKIIAERILDKHKKAFEELAKWQNLMKNILNFFIG